MRPIDVALTEYYTAEGSGMEDNPEVLKYFDSMGLDGKKLHDSTAWCSAFMNYCHIKTRYKHSGELNARSWLSIGNKVNVPKLGDVCIFWREDPYLWKGHVGFYINETEYSIRLLGGNQQNMVQIINYPKKRLLDIRRPVK